MTESEHAPAPRTAAEVRDAAERLASKLTAKQLAARIDAHLKRFEKDPEINQYDPGDSRRSELRPYWTAGSWASGRYVRVVYISYQGSSPIPKQEAAVYLVMLDGGFVGRHYEAFRKHKADLEAGP